MEIAQLDFQQLRIKHILGKSKVRSMLYGGTFDEAFFSPSGPVNSWFETVGKIRYRNEPELNLLLLLQKEINLTANSLHGLYRRGEIDRAHDGLKDIEKLSDKFLEHLKQLESRYNYA